MGAGNTFSWSRYYAEQGMTTGENFTDTRYPQNSTPNVTAGNSKPLNIIQAIKDYYNSVAKGYNMQTIALMSEDEKHKLPRAVQNAYVDYELNMNGGPFNKLKNGPKGIKNVFKPAVDTFGFHSASVGGSSSPPPTNYGMGAGGAHSLFGFSGSAYSPTMGYSTGEYTPSGAFR
jgi:hypothetical protein